MKGLIVAKVDKHVNEGVIGGVIVLALGVLFFINNTLGIDVRWHKYWPLLLVAAGLIMILNKLKP